MHRPSWLVVCFSPYIYRWPPSEGPLLAIQRAIRLGEEEGLQLPLLLRRPCGGALVALAVLARSLAAVSTLLGLAARESLGAQPLVADAASDLNGATDAARKLYGGGMLSHQIGSGQTGGLPIWARHQIR